MAKSKIFEGTSSNETTNAIQGAELADTPAVVEAEQSATPAIEAHRQRTKEQTVAESESVVESPVSEEAEHPATEAVDETDAPAVDEKAKAQSSGKKNSKKSTAKKKGRQLKTIIADIRVEIQKHGLSSFKLGTLLCEAKAKHGKHGDWGDWLDDNFKMSLTTARRLMRFARGAENLPTLVDLGLSKADIILRLPKKDRDTFIKENAVAEMGVRELEKLVKSHKGEKAAIAAKPVDLQKKVDSFEKSLNTLIALFNENSIGEGTSSAKDKLRRLLEEKISEVKSVLVV